MFKTIKNSLKHIYNIFTKGVKKIMSMSIDKCREVAVDVMKTEESRNKSGDMMIACGLGIALIGLAISDHRPHKPTEREMNSIRYFINRTGWILVVSSWVLPHYIINTTEIENKEEE